MVQRHQGRCPGRDVSQSPPGEEREEQTRHTGTCKVPGADLDVWSPE